MMSSKKCTFLPQYGACVKVRIFGRQKDAVFGVPTSDSNKMVNCLPQLGIYTDGSENRIGNRFCRVDDFASPKISGERGDVAFTVYSKFLSHKFPWKNRGIV